MSQEEMKAKIKAVAQDGRIHCDAAFQLAEELGITRREMGDLLNELRIKITQCQLGCF
ncbi:MAG: hypothetical protein AB1491_12250 [Thermodesulfobacteriota bacterium]